ncbi:hypothetical protein CDAR_466792 [Caerostris darwini]|uniref:Arginine/serine-rich protein PNISR n=1 Tax=Caerostris darwini TaxID=1538125 RepID=A0AAV4UHD6_9ARAC|nr:hypothetical protein CDAR_466792 [Caerostris darwini]
MWGSQDWSPWAVQPTILNNVPHEQIDWAELAKQWIRMQQAQPDPMPMVPPPPPIPPPPPPHHHHHHQVVSSLPPPPPGHESLILDEFPDRNIVPPPLNPPIPPPAIPEPFHAERPYENEPAPFIQESTDNNFWNKSQWETNTSNDVDERLWSAPPVEPAVSTPLLAGKETFDYGHMHDNPPLAMQSIDYNHMSDFTYNQVYPAAAPAPSSAPVPVPVPISVPETHYDQYWSQINAAPAIAPMFLKKERTATNVHVEEEETTQIDAAKRKQLPAWIRDGLEKMEQERLKRLEKERSIKENAEKKAKMGSLKKDLAIKNDTSPISISTKSKFDSDSEVDENETDKLTKKTFSTVFKKRTPSPVEDTRTEEEKKFQLILKVRQTLTEVLLSVTNSEMVEIAQEMFRKAKSKAPARQLASTTPLSAVASGLRGLASYGTESEASDQEDDSSDSEEELYRKIKEKKRLFAQKEKKIIADLERKEREEKNEKEKMNNDKGSEKKSTKELSVPEKSEEVIDHISEAKDDHSEVQFKSEEHILQTSPSKISVQSEDLQEKNHNEITEATESMSVNLKKENFSDSEVSNSSHSDSGEKHKKKSHKEGRKEKSETKKTSKKDKSSSKHYSHKRSKSRDSGSSDKHRRERSCDKKNISKKKKKYKRSDSSSSNNSLERKKYSSRYESSRSHREHGSDSYDKEGKHRRLYGSKERHRNDSRQSRSSRSHKYSDEKYEKKYREYRHSPSPSHGSRLPRKYRSRSLSSESQSSGKKSRKHRNH